MGQSGVLPHPAGLKGKIARLVDGGGGHLVPRALVHGEGLAGEGRLVHGGGSLQDHAVHGNGLAGPDHHPLPHPDFLHGDLQFHSVPQDRGRLGGQIHQAGNGLGGLALGPGLQEFTQRDEGQDHPGRLEVQVHVVLGHPRHIAVAQAPAHLVDGKDTVDDGGGGAHGNERIHIGRAMQQRLDSYLIIFIVKIHDGQRQQQLGQPEGHGVLVPQQKGGQGRPHHVAHGDIKQGDQKDKGPDQPALHGGQLLGHGIVAGLDRRFVSPAALGQRGPVARIHHRFDNVVCGQNVLVVLNRHGVGHQTHIGGLDPLQLADGLLHMGRAGGTGHACNVEFLLHSLFPQILTLSAPGIHPPGVGYFYYKAAVTLCQGYHWIRLLPLCRKKSEQAI